MKHYALFAGLLIFLCSCQEGVLIKGEVKDLPRQTLILEEITIAKPVFIDSVASNDDGSFELNVNAKEEKMYRVSFINERYIMLALKNGDKAQIKADWNNLENYQVSGSPSSGILKSFILGTRENIISLNTMQMIVDTLKKKGASDSMQKASINALASENTKFMDFIKNFADTTTSVSTALTAVNLINPKFEAPFIKQFYEKLNTRFPNSELAVAYKNRFEGVKTTDTNPSASNSGEPAPDFTLMGADGKEITLSSYRGKYVLVDFWASWCGPCRKENPNVVEAYKKFKGMNFTVLGISLDTDKFDWKNAIKKDNLTWDHASDLIGFGSPVAKLYKIGSIPANVLVDPNGNIVAKNLSGDNLLKTLEKILK